MKKFTIFIMILLVSICGLMAQAPGKFTYQAVIRDESNQLMMNTNVGVRVSILQGSVNGSAVFVESFSTTTNDNGLLTIEIGTGNAQSGNFTDIDWSGGSYFLNMEVDPNGEGTYSISITQPLTSVPYALYANEAGNGFSGDYNDLVNKPQIPQSVGELTNDASYITLNDLPEIPTVPENISEFTNDVGYITGYTETQTLADVTANGNSAGNRQLKNVSDPTDAQDAVTQNYLIAQINVLTNIFHQQMDAFRTMFQDQIDSLANLIADQQAQIDALQNMIDSVLQGRDTALIVPAVSTDSATSVTETSATLNATITNPDNVMVTTMGFEWKVIDAESYTQVVGANEGNIFTANLTGLVSGTSYIFRAFISYGDSIVYGEEITFITSTAIIEPTVFSVSPCTVFSTHPAQMGSDFQGNGHNGANHGYETVVDGHINSVTDYDGNEYPVVQIGGQCWLAENLRCTHSPNTGTYIVNNQLSGTNASTYTGKMACWYNNDSITYSPLHYGLLYNWNSAIDTYNLTYGELSINTNYSNALNVMFVDNRQGICPVGWHMPSDAEWTTMEIVVNGGAVSETNTGYRGSHAGKLSGGDNWKNSSAADAPGNYSDSLRNSSGFSAISTDNSGYNCTFWSSSIGNDGNVWRRTMDYDKAGVARNYSSKTNRFSVRCVRNTSVGVTAPTISVAAAMAVTDTTATLNAFITNPDNVTITAVGFEWKQTVGGTYSSVLGAFENGVLTTILANLNPGTLYSYRAYITYSGITVYSDERIFTTAFHSTVINNNPCSGLPAVDYDGNTYNTLAIGQQCWMAENLRTTHYSDGTAISLGSSTNYNKAYRYYPDHNSSTVPLYGYLYNWKAVMQDTPSSNSNPSGVQGICPDGWHVPSDSEWVQLSEYLSSQSCYVCGSNTSNIAKALAATTGWDNSSTICQVGNDQESNNSTGFGVRPAGEGGTSSSNFGRYAYYWSASERGTMSATGFVVSYGGTGVGCYSEDKSVGRSIRCLKNETSGNTPIGNYPTVTTSSMVTNVSETTATLNAVVLNPENVSITAQGFEWKVFSGGSYTQVVGVGSGGCFTATLTGLTANTKYKYRAFISYSDSIVYGNELTFTTASSFVLVDAQPCPEAPTLTDYDGNTYNTVQIGQQCWMQENLRTTHYASGTSIPVGSYNSTVEPFRYIPNGNSSTVPTYGYLYNWKAVMGDSPSSNAIPSGVQGICPTGWHVPSDEEWMLLREYVKGQNAYTCAYDFGSYIAKALAATEGWNVGPGIECSAGDNQSTNNATGFTARPAGSYSNGYSSFGNSAFFYSTSITDNGKAKYWIVSNSSQQLQEYSYSSNVLGLSVRCLKD